MTIMNYFTKEHEMFRESLRDFLNKEVNYFKNNIFLIALLASVWSV